MLIGIGIRLSNVRTEETQNKRANGKSVPTSTGPHSPHCRARFNLRMIWTISSRVALIYYVQQNLLIIAQFFTVR